jgi:hypothetical protein
MEPVREYHQSNTVYEGTCPFCAKFRTDIYNGICDDCALQMMYGCYEDGAKFVIHREKIKSW